jgi:hypothetical protein
MVASPMFNEFASLDGWLNQGIPPVFGDQIPIHSSYFMYIRCPEKNKNYTIQ